MKLYEFAKILNGKILNLKEDFEVKGLSIDSRRIKSGELFFALNGDSRDGHDFVLDALKNGASGAVVEKKLNVDNLIVVKNVNKSLLDFSLWKLSKIDIPKICITGSSGKTSTKELIANVLGKKFNVFKTSKNYNNLIGIPLSLWDLSEDDEVAVFEVGMSFHGEIFKITEIIKPDFGIITNIGTVHMMNFNSRRELASAKFELIENLKDGGYFFYNGDDVILSEFAKKFCINKSSVGFSNYNDYLIKNLKLSLNGLEFDLKFKKDEFHINSQFLSKAFSYNIAFAFIIGLEFGINPEDIKESISNFKPFSHRCEIIKLKNGSFLIDDTYNSNPEALINLLETVFEISRDREVVLVLGEMKELGELSEVKHREIGRYLKDKNFKRAFFISGDSRYMFEEVGNERGEFFESYRDSEDDVLKSINENTLVVVKGSRGVTLDKIVEKILEVYGE